MNLTDRPDDIAFREDVRAFLKSALAPDIIGARRSGIMIERSALQRWQRRLYDRGWVAPAWPRAEGGTGWTATQKHIFEEELSAANAPRLSPFGLSMVGPVIYTYGTPEQKARHLPGILTGETAWCQGYSEPGAGSDLANLKTAAVRDGDEYVVNGQKIWTSYAHEADWIFCLVRTNPDVKAQQGISFLLIDMRTPGIEVKPIISIDGLHHLNEVFFTDVRVPVGNRIGEENKGWTYAKVLLLHERTNIAGVAESKKRLQELKRIAALEADDAGDRLLDDPDFRSRLTELEVALTALEFTNLRALARSEAGGLGPEASLLKVSGTEVQQRLAELTVEAIGVYAAPFQREQLLGLSNEPVIGPDYALSVVANYNFGRAASIYGGSNEIQRNVMAKAVLGL